MDAPLESLLATLSAWHAMGLSSVELTGGEPMLHPHFWDILRSCAGIFDSVALLTNGTLIDETAAEMLAAQRDRVIIGISLDGPEPAIHDEVRGRESFLTVTKAIQLLAGRGLRVRVGMVVTEKNWRHIIRTRDVAHSLGAWHFSYSPALPYGRARGSNLSLSAEEAAELAEQEKHLMTRALEDGFLKTLLREQLESSVRFTGNCGLGHKNVAVAPNGDVRACLFFPSQDNIGNIFNEPLTRVFQRLAAYRELAPPGPKTCGDCCHLPYCKDCAARAMSSIEERQIWCTWARKTRLSEVFPRFERYARMSHAQGCKDE